MSSPSSLRDLYAPPSTSWTFEANDRLPAPLGPAASPSPAYQWATRPSPNSLLDLSPSLAEPGMPDAALLVKAMVASALMQYTTAAIAMPFDVGKTLLQVQWVPRDADELPVADEEVTVVEEVGTHSYLYRYVQ
jgi:fusion and transport protein UGO1